MFNYRYYAEQLTQYDRIYAHGVYGNISNMQHGSYINLHHRPDLLFVGYLRCVTLMNVVIAPFHNSVFGNEVFNKYLNTCREWIIKKCSETKERFTIIRSHHDLRYGYLVYYASIFYNRAQL